MADKMMKARDTGVEKKLGMSLDDIIASGPKPRQQQRQQPYTPMRKNQHQNIRQQPYRAPSQTDESGLTSRGMLRTGTGGFEKRAYTVLVSNLPPMDQRELENVLKATFGVCGKVTSIKLRGNHAYVGFDDSSSCSKALTELKGSRIKGNVITIDKGIPVPVTPRQSENRPITSQQIRGRPNVVANGRMNTPLTIRRNQGVSTTLPSQHRTVLPSTPYGVYAPEPSPLQAYMLPQAGLVYGYPAASSYVSSSSSSLLPQSKIPSSALSTYQLNGAATLTGKGQATVVVSNVPEELTAQEIQGAFSCVGTVTRTEILLNSSGVHTGRVAVTFSDKQSALEAVKRFDGGDLNSNTIRVFLE